MNCTCSSHEAATDQKMSLKRNKIKEVEELVKAKKLK